ncbi:MAG: phosphonate ABC transporter, permease protein PhnE [Halofilum sp. (in: g-proteobacteria)]
MTQQPGRFQRPSLPMLCAAIVFAAVVLWSFDGVELSLRTLAEGLPQMGRVLGEMMPPDFSRAGSIADKLLETFQMAVAGTVLAIAFSLPIGVFAARTQSPHALLYHLSRAVVTFCRTVPDLIWAIFFVVTVGLGPFAGVLALMMEAIGFCGRFFAEAIEEVEEGPQEGLRAVGASRVGIVMCTVIPAALPSMVASSLFALEKAVRSSVVLGLVGAGGIGVELTTAMDMYEYQTASAIILCIFAMIIVVERVSAMVRARIM